MIDDDDHYYRTIVYLHIFSNVFFNYLTHCKYLKLNYKQKNNEIAKFMQLKKINNFTKATFL